MTIAACYLSPEGVVLGADSAATFGSRNHFFHEQKIFEVGESGQSTLGLSTWGLGSMVTLSYRTVIGRFSDEVRKNPEQTVEDRAVRWGELFWGSFGAEYKDIVDEVAALNGNPSRSDEEEERLAALKAGYSDGFCLCGYCPSDRIPRAFSVIYGSDNPGQIEEISFGKPEFWGQPNMLRRLELGIDLDTFFKIANKKMPDGSPMWNGTSDDLVAIILENKLSQPSRHLPIREAIDWVYSSIYTALHLNFK